MVGIVNHVCSVLARPGMCYVRQAPACTAASEGLGTVLAVALGR